MTTDSYVNIMCLTTGGEMRDAESTAAPQQLVSSDNKKCWSSNDLVTTTLKSYVIVDQLQ